MQLEGAEVYNNFIIVPHYFSTLLMEMRVFNVSIDSVDRFCCRRFISIDIDFASDALHFQRTALIRTEHIAVLHHMFVCVLFMLTMENLLITAELLKLE